MDETLDFNLSPGELAPFDSAQGALSLPNGHNITKRSGLGDMVNAVRLRRMQGGGGTGRKLRSPIGHLLFLRKVLHPRNILEI
jgi:hypothetical protein